MFMIHRGSPMAEASGKTGAKLSTKRRIVPRMMSLQSSILMCMQHGGSMSDFTQTTTPIQVLRMKQVCRLTGLGRSMIYLLEQHRRFPSRIKLTDHAVGWVESEVQGWLAERIAASRARKQAAAAARRTS